jgi:hypothetical protein
VTEDDRDPQLRDLYRRLSRELPPARTDALILAAAAREVGPRHWWQRFPRLATLAPAATAVAALVTLSVVIWHGGDFPGPPGAQQAMPSPATRPMQRGGTAERPPSDGRGMGSGTGRGGSDSGATRGETGEARATRGAGEVSEGERVAPGSRADVPPPEPPLPALPAAERDAPRRPAEWLAQVRTLVEAGHDAEAQAELARMKRAFPEFPVPADVLTAPETTRR